MPKGSRRSTFMRLLTTLPCFFGAAIFFWFLKKILMNKDHKYLTFNHPFFSHKLRKHINPHLKQILVCSPKYWGNFSSTHDNVSTATRYTSPNTNIFCHNRIFACRKCSKLGCNLQRSSRVPQHVLPKVIPMDFEAWFHSSIKRIVHFFYRFSFSIRACA